MQDLLMRISCENQTEMNAAGFTCRSVLSPELAALVPGLAEKPDFSVISWKGILISWAEIFS